MSRVYADINSRFGPGWYDYGECRDKRSKSIGEINEGNLGHSILERTHIDWNVPDNYEILHRVGGGRYSEVRTNLH